MVDHGNGGKQGMDGPCRNAHGASTPYPRPKGDGRWRPTCTLPLLADAEGDAPDTLGVGAERPSTPATPDPPDTGPPITYWPGLLCHVRGRYTKPGPGRIQSERGTAAGPAPGHSAAGPGHSGALQPAAGTARPDPLVVHTVWHVLAGSAGRPHLPGWLRPSGRPPPKRGRQSSLRHRQLVIGKRSTEYQALRSAGLADAGTATQRIDQPCPGREWGRRYHAWRHNLHRLAAIDQALFAPTPPKGEGPRTWFHGRCRSCSARLNHPTNSRGASLISCGDVGSNPGPPPKD